MFRDFVWRTLMDSVAGGASDSIHYNRAFYLENVYLDSSYFSERHGPNFEEEFRIYERDNLLDSLKPGNETYFVLFRNYRIRNFPNSPGSFQLIVKVDEGVPDLKKSIVYDYSSSGFPRPHPAWFPREVYYADDSLELRAGNNHTRDSIRVRVKFHIDSSFDLIGYRSNFKAMHKLW